MNSDQFTYWLQGFIEMNPNAMITHTQWETLKDHLKTVFHKETQDRFGISTSPVPGLNLPNFPPNTTAIC
ncbi:hypothetical protein [Pseudomonas phage vB_PseuGesM_254]|uniref:Uncharacterized protein n=1 Tax=Pseudomonas phage vB_PseuGesM_254 TaxID=3092638 RepID=A0AAX4G6J3_9CAUD|nr:hypothetical protein [Pseudomonas phage PseuGes_254]